MQCLTCFSPPHIVIATSGPSDTYPQRAYRNPLDELIRWLDRKHDHDWAIWEFRAEGTGYPDEAVYNRVWHFPWPDHHPPPFALLPNILASMRNWLHGGDVAKQKTNDESGAASATDAAAAETAKNRVVVVHCKAGKGRSGTASVSYLIAEEGWKREDALRRFTERRMRPGFGSGLSIPSQIRWVGYVDRWAQVGKKMYVERAVEVLEVHMWGLRDGVKIAIEGYVDEGRTIKMFHTFGQEEREIVRGEIKDMSGFAEVVTEVMKRKNLLSGGSKTPKPWASPQGSSPSLISTPPPSADDSSIRATHSDPGSPTGERENTNSLNESGTSAAAIGGNGASGADAIFRPRSRVVLPTSDVNIDVERRNRAAYGWTMVTSVAHVWFNAYFEGQGPERAGEDKEPDDSGVFEITWEAMDGIKGSSRKGVRAFDRMAVVWKALPDDDTRGRPSVVIREPAEGEEVPQSQPADWHGERNFEPTFGRKLGLRVATPTASAAESRTDLAAQSERGQKQTRELAGSGDSDGTRQGELPEEQHRQSPGQAMQPGGLQEFNHTVGLRPHGPDGEDIVHAGDGKEHEAGRSTASGDQQNQDEKAAGNRD
ncbi:hypothetical protein BDY21DRAFT_55936 [Lineolata rhizophorae]|uniref:phosphatidylinositol-3,4,5-trisphosphate 3-phosphatase n=1 Tax=Lineolata rhizophorae TaxID=578093 RepID=A0A6A6NX92_9PEZI|nr:hypothetical protein BDY21DRAFT_55936 [Lineolata rhizophorae]